MGKMGIVETPDVRVVAEMVKKTMEVTTQMRELTQRRGTVAQKELDFADKILGSLADVLYYLQPYESTDHGSRDYYTSVASVPPGAASGGLGRKAKGGGGASKKRSLPSSCKKISSTLEDGHKWRKYGQKVIHSSKYSRSYYRCSYKKTMGCKAKRQAQQIDHDPETYMIIYIGHHTCKEKLPVSAIDNDHHSSSDLVEEKKIPPEQRAPELCPSTYTSTNDSACENLGGALARAGQPLLRTSKTRTYDDDIYDDLESLDNL